MKDYKNLIQNELNDEFIDACRSGEVEIVKYLLTSSELKTRVDVHLLNDSGFGWACENGHFEIVKYLLVSSELEEHINIHANNDEWFKWACSNDYLELIKFLVFDMEIEKTNEIDKFLKNEKYQEIENLFKIRDLNKQLENELDFSYNGDNKKNKL